MDYTTTALLASIKRRALLPSSQSTFQTADLLAFANEELQSRLVPYILSTREDYFVASADFAINADATTAYRIPTRAIGGKLRAVYRVDANNGLMPLPLLDLYDLDGRMDLAGYTIQSNSVVLTASAASLGGTLRMLYYQRPSELVAVADAAIVLGYTVNTRRLDLTADPPAALQGRTDFDAVKVSAPFEILVADATVGSAFAAGTTSYTTGTDISAGLSAGDYVCVAGQSPVPNIPPELHPILAQRVAVKCLEALGDSEGLANARAQLAEMESNILGVIEQRVDGAPRKMKGGILGARPAFWRGGW